MILLRRWCLMIVLSFFNSHLFNLNDWKFWLTSLLIAFAIGNLFDKDEK